MRRAGIWLFAGVLLVGGGMGIWWSEHTPTVRPSQPWHTRTQPNVLVVIWDAARARSLSVYDYDRPTTPFLEGLSQDSAVCLRAHSQASNTLPSMTSLFTGVYPQEHGAHWIVSKGQLTAIVPASEELPTLAEVAQDAGWWTEAQVGNPWLSDKTGLNRGFDHFQSWQGYENREEITQAVMASVDELQGTPWLIVAHYIDPHAPYLPPEPILAEFARATYTGPVTPHQVGKLRRGELAWGPEEVIFLQDRYDAELRALDADLQRLVEHLQERDLLEHTLVIVTADHGEALGDHGTWEHRTLYEEILHIPLVLRFPDRAWTGRWDPLVDSVDLFPTIATFLDVSIPPSVQGHPLQDQLRGTWQREHSLAWNPGINTGSVLSRDGSKLIQTTTGLQWYDLASDPLEQTDLARDDATQAAVRWQQSLQWQAQWLSPRPTRRTRLSTEENAALEVLGYTSDEAENRAIP